MYWISLLKDANYIDEKVYNSIQAEATEILKMLISIVKTT
ncbi:MAG: four helix bundle protein, partial [Paludibacteraceae bacterium]|nr:four helix bundle protein [Paludibacteraceae bacterium]